MCFEVIQTQTSYLPSHLNLLCVCVSVFSKCKGALSSLYYEDTGLLLYFLPLVWPSLCDSFMIYLNFILFYKVYFPVILSDLKLQFMLKNKTLNKTTIHVYLPSKACY